VPARFKPCDEELVFEKTPPSHFEVRPGFAAKIRPALALLAGVSLTACTSGPDYVPPAAPAPAQFKESKGWKIAKPIDTLDRGAWWSVYKDPRLSSLMSQVEISNQTVTAAAAAYEQARALIREAQAGYFPTVTNSYNITGTHEGGAVTGTGTSTTRVTFNPVANATWEIDVWGRVRRTVESDAAAAQVSAADLQNAKLSAQATLASAYFNMRAAESLKTLLDKTVVEYKKTLEIVRNQYAAGTVSQADVVTAETQVLNTQAASIATDVTRALNEHAIAVLIGKPPADLTLARGALAYTPPHIPVTVPSALLERRPDIAAAERTLQEENALIGVAVANFYPTVNLTGMFGFAGATPLPITAANEAWTLVGSVTQTVFDGGLRSAQLAAAKAAYEQNVATYRQTVLTSFEQVEDALASIRILTQELRKWEEAIKQARLAVEVYLNQYRAGTVSFTTVVVAEATLLADEESGLAVRQSLFIASVSLIEALGGGWDTSLLPSLDGLSTVPTLTPPL